ncbi:MAG: S8 family serine peptidase [Acidobacteria bacterium]|nr:S8 family serine peptidase [Acidobacteriota bacterium]
MQQYLVKLRDAPVIRHLHSQPNASKLRHALRHDLRAPAATQYRSRLRAKQAALKRLIENLPDATVQAQMDTVFNGMAVTLRPQDVPAVMQFAEVEEVIPSIRYYKALDTALPLAGVPQAWMDPSVGGEGNAGKGVKIAIIDTGIDTSHPMFQDPSLALPDSFPRFTPASADCPGSDEDYTNSKVIVARNYVSLLGTPDPNCDAEDRDGHGTFVAAIAAGNRVTGPSASIAGVAPRAFLGSYKVFGTPGFNDTASLGAIVKAVEDAVNDGMDIINMSLGSTSSALPSNDTLSQSVATAVLDGVTVVTAAGNQGPGTGTIGSPGISPDAITVGGTTNSRTFANPLRIAAPGGVPTELEQLAALPGNGPPLAATVGPAPLLDVASVSSSDKACSQFPLDLLAGALVLISRGNCNFSEKILNAYLAGAIGVVIFNNQLNQPPIAMDVQNITQIPAVMIGNIDGLSLKQFLSTAGPDVTASIGAVQEAIPATPNRMSNFSSNGPSTDFGIKPDMVAPGVDLYSATQRNFPDGEQYNPAGFDISSGTSFATPMVAGAAALVKQANPAFTPAQIKSALVNTTGKQVSSFDGGPAGLLSRGNGLLDAEAALGTVATVSPVSLSFGAQTPGTILSTTANLAVTNVSAAAETFTITSTPAAGSESLTLSASPAGFTLVAGETSTITVTAISSEPLDGTVQGFLTLSGENSGKTITVPYWGTFLQPRVNSSGVINAASFSSGSPLVSAGSLITIFGTQMADTTAVAQTVPLPLSLGGVTVTFGGNQAPLLFVSPNQINAQVPVELAGRTSAQLVVEINGLSSVPEFVLLSPAAPGIFTLDQSGGGRGAILHASDASLVTPAQPARPGEFLELFATGLGTTSPPVDTGIPASSNPLSRTQTTPFVTIGGISAPVTFSGLAPTFVGLYQVNIQVPFGVSAGEHDLVLSSNGVNSNPVTIAIGE